MLPLGITVAFLYGCFFTAPFCCLNVIIIRSETVVSIREMLADISYFAAQNIAENIQRVDSDVFVFSETIELAFADSIIMNELILRNLACFEHDPKLVKFNHGIPLFDIKHNMMFRSLVN